MTSETPELGLRERKRLATRRSIQLTAIRLANELGLERVTVDEISRVADVSPRTFFNYFPTKEAALVGDNLQLPDEDAIDAFIAGAPETVLAGIARLLTVASDQVADDPELTSSRRALMRQYPQLLALGMLGLRSVELELQGVVERRLEADGVPAGAERSSRARLLTLVAFAALRHALGRWVDGGAGSDLSARLEQSFAELEQLLA